MIKVFSNVLLRFMSHHEPYMYRCLDLAARGAGYTAPNPMVGAVLVHEDLIIGEGFTQPYGGAHAEVMCLESVAAEHAHLTGAATLYVSLEPCAHYGRTPPCTELIIRKNVKRVVVGCGDPFAAVNGRGIAQLRAAGIEVITGVLEEECIATNRRFFTFHIKQRPYIILKWARSANAMLAAAGGRPVAISGTVTNQLVHRWRSEEAAIFIGRNTAVTDNPSLTTRLWPGKNPVRVVADSKLILPGTLNIFNGMAPVIVINSKKEEQGVVSRVKVPKGDQFIKGVLEKLVDAGLTSLIVEGGAMLLESFIREGLWDEIRTIENTAMVIPDGVPAPYFTNGELYDRQQLGTDIISYYYNPMQNNYFKTLTNYHT